MSVFNRVKQRKVVRSRFNLSHGYKMTGNSGLLYPCLAIPTVPGDVFDLATGIELRSMPLVAPMMHHINLDVRYFYVPNRLVWDNFQEFLMGIKVAGNEHIHPFVKSDEDDYSDMGAIGTLSDYLGIPRQCAERVDALPFRAYNLIWNEYFRDQNLQQPVDVDKSDGGEFISHFNLLRCCWKKDYFSSALPWTQSGDEVTMNSLVTVTPQDWSGDPLGPSWFDMSEGPDSALLPSNQSMPLVGIGNGASLTGNIAPGYVMGYLGNNANVSSASKAYLGLDPNGSLSSSVSLLELRRAAAVQRFLERSALVGSSRYADWIRGMFGVSIGDASLQRPLYLGGGTAGVNISPVEQNSSTVTNSPQGNLAGKGYLLNGFRTNRKWAFAEHGWIIGLAFIRPEAVYSQGLERKFIRDNRFSYYMPGFENIGEQEILNCEVNCIPGNVAQAAIYNRRTFGYQSRYSDLKWMPSTIHGEFKTTLKHWVQPRVLGDPYPSNVNPIPLNSDFVECWPEEDNNFAVSSKLAHHYLMNMHHFVTAYRPLQYFPNYALK